MKISTANRLYIVGALVLATYGGAHLVKAELEPPEVLLPTWTIRELPLELGDWRGVDTELDPKITAAVGASVIVDRAYQDRIGHVISMHTAMFENPVEGVIHSPLNCYRASGWVRKNESRETLQLSDNLTIPVSLTTWEREGERVLVVYWYQLGEHVLFGRWDLGLKVRWSLAGRPQWPALIKVMLQISAPESPEDTELVLLSFAERVAEWENQPEHRKQMLVGSGESI